jgi:hypothetical protein
MILTNGDLKAIRGLMQPTIDEKVEELGLVTKDDIKHLPTKEEYSREDKTMKELKDIRAEITVINGRISDHSDRIENLEKNHPQRAHFSPI